MTVILDIERKEDYEGIQFLPLNVSDVPLIHKWFNTPHVQQFYSLRNWSEDEVLQKISPYISGEKPVWVFIVTNKSVPIGYIQYYRVTDFPWPEQNLPELVIQQGAGMDLFIGDAAFLGKGYGKIIIKHFLDEKIWPNFNYCVVDPDVKNEAAIHCYNKLGFKKHKIIHTENALSQQTVLFLMISGKHSGHCQYTNLKENMLNIYGEEGQKWIMHLPAIVDDLSTHWELSHITPVDNMTFHFVAKAMRQNNQQVVLKVGYDKNVINSEMRTLKYLSGQAAIQLIDYNAAHNALLLQQAMPGISLKSLYPSQLDLVMDCYVKTMLKLHKKSLPKRHDFPHIREWLNAIDRVGKDKLPIDLIEKAIRLKNNLLNSLTHEILLHGDLHLDNVLQDGDEWVIIDPKGIVGDAEFEIAAFDFIYHSELDNKEVKDFYEKSIALISQKSNLNFQRIKDWVFVRLILSAAWSIEDNMDYSWAIKLARFL